MIPELHTLRELWLDGDQSQQTLASNIGIDRSALNKLLNDPKRRPMPRTLRKIQKFLAEREARRPRRSK